MTPVQGYVVSSVFGEDRGSYSHKGVDLAVGEGTPVVSCYGGTVKIATFDSGYGNYVSTGTELFAHLSRINVVVGQKIGVGTKIGEVGSTGDSTGNHLHYEVTMDGQKVNPLGENVPRETTFVDDITKGIKDKVIDAVIPQDLIDKSKILLTIGVAFVVVVLVFLAYTLSQ